MGQLVDGQVELENKIAQEKTVGGRVRATADGTGERKRAGGAKQDARTSRMVERKALLDGRRTFLI